MKKEFKPAYYLGLAAFVLTIIANVGKATDFLGTIGIQNTNKSLDLALQILNIILPLIMIWVLLIISKAMGKFDEQKKAFQEQKDLYKQEFKQQNEFFERQFQQHRQRFDEYTKDVNEDRAMYRKNVSENTLSQLSNINELYKRNNELKNQVDSMNVFLQTLMVSSGTTTRTIVAYLNGLKTEDEIIQTVDAIYGNCNIPELEKIGVKGDLINLMKARYHAEQLGVVEREISFNKDQENNKENKNEA